MGLPEEIQEWVHKHYYNLWFHQKGRNIAGLMDDLPFVLHSDLSSCCYKSVIENVSHLMNYCNLGHDNNNNNNNNVFFD